MYVVVDDFSFISDRFIWNRNVNFVAIYLKAIGLSSKAYKKQQPNIIIIKHWWHLIAASIEQDKTRQDNRKAYEKKKRFILILSNVVNGLADWWCIEIIPWSMNIG